MEIPAKAKRVFKGIIFDVYQWRQKMFDGSFQTFEKVSRQHTVVVIPVIDGKIAIIRQKQPDSRWFLGLPSGRMDKAGETPKEAALRELAEETGLVPKSIKLWKTYSPSGKVIQKVHFYIARGCRQAARQSLDAGEKIKVKPVTFQQLLEATDNPRCFLGPLMIDVLLARIHKSNRRYLYESIFGSWIKPPKPPLKSPSSGWKNSRSA